ncbi:MULTISPECIES: hypothetical protein [Pseudomonas]|uniref:hypothetical protein n=1 Tax=Pseudomonas TaxID=286 RepID=UPI00257CAC23|nr:MULTISPECIES: hypothetical protein [Pseudomonas]
MSDYRITLLDGDMQLAELTVRSAQYRQVRRLLAERFPPEQGFVLIVEGGRELRRVLGLNHHGRRQIRVEYLHQGGSEHA